MNHYPTAQIRFISALVLAIAMLAGGCGDGKKRVEADGNAKTIVTAALRYQSQKGAWPDSIDQFKSLIPDYASAIVNPLTGDNPGYEYVKPPNDNGSAIVVYQLRGGKRDTSLPVAYSDGSVRPMDAGAK